MSGLSSINQTTIAFKNLLNKSHTDLGKGLGNEAEDIKFNVHSNTIFVSLISSTPATAVAAGVAVQLNADLTLDVTSNGHAYFATWPLSPPAGTDPITSTSYAYGSGTLVGISAGDRVKNAISFSYGNGYEAIPYAGSPIPANRISIGDARNWVYQYQSGVFYQENTGSTPTTLTVYAYTGQYLTDAIGDFIPLSGATDSNPVTGLISMFDGTGFYLKGSPSNATFIKFDGVTTSPNIPRIIISGQSVLTGGVMSYDIDRSGSYTNRTVVDKEYVDKRAGGTKNIIHVGETITVNAEYQYLVYGNLYLNGTLNNAGQVCIINGTLILGGSGVFNNTGSFIVASLKLEPNPGYVSKNSNYTLAPNDYVVECTSGSFTITLPTAVGITGKNYIIKNTGGGTITIATTSSQTIDGSAPGTLSGTTPLKLVSTGSNWITV